MDSVLIASNTNTTLGMLSSLLQEQTFTRMVTAADTSEGRRQVMDYDFDLIIIDTPLKDEFGNDFALHVAEETTAGIMYITNYENLYDANEELENAGIFVLPKPISPEFFYQATKLLNASRKRLKKLESENTKLQRKIEEIRLVDRAKCALIQYLNMTEQQAHHHIEKQAMDLRKPRIAVARSILMTYEH